MAFGRWLTVSKMAAVVLPFLGIPAAAQVDRFYGEPVQLKSNYIYFTSWKYVRQGSFGWKIDYPPDATDEDRKASAWLKGDGPRPAVFTPYDMPRGIRLVAQKADKRPAPAGQPVANVFDEGKFKAWYWVGPSAEPEPFSTKDRILPGYDMQVAYAESADGVTWNIPKLGIIESGADKDNNIVFRGDLDGSTRGFHGGSVFIDPSSTDERYKMIYLGIITDDEWNAFAAKYPDEVDTMARRKDVNGFRCVCAVFGAVSPDGIHWKSLPDPLMIQHADTLNTCYYDVECKQYVAYVRAWQVNPSAKDENMIDTDGWIGVGRRSIGRAVSNDFRHFSKPVIVVSTGADMPPNHLHYTNCKTTLPGIPDNHIMFPWIWELDSDSGATWLLSSPDGSVWSRVPGGPVVDMGLPGTPTGGYVHCSGNLLEYPDGIWGIGYKGCPIPHKYPGRVTALRKGLFPGVPEEEGIAVWPKGRLVALQCDEDGEFATVAVVPPGDRLRINASVRPTGYIRVAVRRLVDGQEIPGRSFENADRIIGDGLAIPVTWQGNETIEHDGKPIILRFQLRQAKLFGVEFH